MVKKKTVYKYRARGHYIPTDRDSWITTVWRKTLQEAKDDIRMFAPATIKRYSKTWVEKREK